MSMVNLCERCHQKCCNGIFNSHNLRGYPTQDEVNQQHLQFIIEYPFFRQTGNYYVDNPDSTQTVVPTYSCLKFDPQTGLCHDYQNRPPLCQNAGIKYPASDNCLLWQSLHPSTKRRSFLFK